MARPRKGTPKKAVSRTTFPDRTLYLVRRLYEDGWDSIFCNSAAADFPQRPEWGAPVKAFTGRGRAEALCGELGKKLLEGMNPFEFHGAKLADLTSLPPGPFRDWLLDAGLKPLPPGKDRLEDWGRWWEKHQRAMSKEQRQQVSAGLDKLRLYEVVELAPPAAGRDAGLAPAESEPGWAADGPTPVNVFSVELLKWKDDDDFFQDLDGPRMTLLEPCISPRGGILLATFRDLGPATAYRDKLQRQVPGHSRAFYRDGFGVAEHTIDVED
jgi:hypothetical protein